MTTEQDVPAQEEPLDVPCARYWGSDGTLCATHNGRFASDTTARCDRALGAVPEGER